MPEDVRFDDRMSDIDALMWGIERDPLLRSTITAVAVLDGPPDRARLLDKIRLGLAAIPRLRQRAVPAPFNVGPPRWVVDPDFDLDYHLRWVRAPGGGTVRDLLDLAAPIAMQGFDRARPLWEFVVVEGLAEGRAALIQKIHPSITDGIGGVQLALMLLDAERDPEPVGDAPAELPAGERLGSWRLLSDALADERRRGLAIAAGSLDAFRQALQDPAAAGRRLQDLGSSTARMLAPAFTPLSTVMTERSLSVHFDVLECSLSDLKAAATRGGARVNDAFVAAVLGGLARYHRRRGSVPETLRMGMPISLRTGSDQVVAGNRFVPARFPVPLTISDARERMQAVRALVETQRAEPALAITDSLAGVLNRLPLGLTTAVFGGLLRGVDVITSNVPGLPFPVYLAGASLQANYAFGPLSGAALNVTLLSYVDEVHIGVNADPAAVTDRGELMDCLREGLEEVTKVG